MTVRMSPGVTLTLCTLLQLCFGTVYAWSFFQTLLVKDLGWTFTDTALAFSVTIFSLGVSAAVAGAALPKVGPRKLALMGSVLFSGGYIIGGFAIQMDSVMWFCLGHGVLGGVGIGMGYVTPVATTAKWFPNRKGLATGIVVMGFGFGALVLSKFLAPLLVNISAGDLSLVFICHGLVFAAVLIPCSILLTNPPTQELLEQANQPRTAGSKSADEVSIVRCLASPEFTVLWVVFFFNIAAGISVISFQSTLLQEVWGAANPLLEPVVLAQYGATLIAVSSIFNGFGRLFWGLLSDRIGRINVFRLLLASQMVVFGLLLTDINPWVFCGLVCYILLCFGGGFATVPSFILDVFGPKRMSTIYGAVLTAWAAAGIFGPLYVGHLKDQYPGRAVTFCFLSGVVILAVGFVFSFLLSDERFRVGRPSLQETLKQLGIQAPWVAIR